MDFIREIIDLDKSAAARVESAVLKQKQRTDEFGENTARERERILGDEREKNASKKAEQDKILAEKRERTEISLGERIAALDKRFADNGAEWRDEIVKRITEG